ncbi:hypothetical protein AMR72_15305 [Flavobacterium psychrophilum]|nr:hypothetical protein AMR72_15305 [Flavobacterium psychrophilum]AOE53759.1 hypothetical protein ALW18_15295 [Flavobacterium psychrophilum]
MTAPVYNIFEVLEKGDKELIHSAFIKFLMQDRPDFYFQFLKLEGDYNPPQLEKTYGKGKQKSRFDIEVQSIDGNAVITVENKFKSFPDFAQLQAYEASLKKYHKKKKHHKFLICFDKEVVSHVEGWIVKDYKDLAVYVREHYDLAGSDDTSVFVRHYYFLLEGYYSRYETLNSDLRPLFCIPVAESNNFWLKLFYHALKCRLDIFFAEKNLLVEVYVNKGNTLTPLMNIVPLHWDNGHKRLLIQFQGNDLKFYLNNDSKELLLRLIDFANECFQQGRYSLKKLTNRESKTCFILKTTITKEHPEAPMTINTVFDLVIAFYKMLDEHIIFKYLNWESKM